MTAAPRLLVAATALAVLAGSPGYRSPSSVPMMNPRPLVLNGQLPCRW